MPAATIDDLRSELMAGRKAVDPAYAAKQLHKVPDAPAVVRETFLLDLVKGKRVLELGASGPMHAAVVKAAAFVLGIDRASSDGVVGFDLDDVTQTDLPAIESPDLILAGEVIEHLSNPGHVLARLKRQYPGVPLVVTVPNAFSEIGLKSLGRGIENVNKDHVAWYSPRTVQTLLERAGYGISSWAWYNGRPRLAEGLIVLAE